MGSLIKQMIAAIAAKQVTILVTKLKIRFLLLIILLFL